VYISVSQKTKIIVPQLLWALLLLHTEALVVASKDTGKTKYLAMSRDQNAGQNHNIKIGNKSIDGVERFTF